MKQRSFGFFIIMLMFVTGLWHGHHPAKREPASLWQGCAQAFRLVMRVSNSPWLGFLRRAPTPHLRKLDANAVQEATQRFVVMLNEGTPFSAIEPQTLEETLGLIEATLITRGFSGVDYTRMDYLKRGKIASLLRQLEKPSRLSMESYESIWSEIFLTRLTRFERIQSVFSGDIAKRQAVALFMQEEIVRLGLKNSAKKYLLLENPEPILRRFMNSKLGKSLSTSLFNLPVLLGMPPMALPRLSRLKLPPDLANDLLEQGLTDVNLSRVDEFLEQATAKRFGIGLGLEQRYELIRRGYSYGLGIYFLALASWEAYVRYHEIDEEEESLDDALYEVEELLGKAELLEEQGYSIFNDSSETAVLSRECRDLRDCLESSIGPDQSTWDKNSATYKECREFVDPQNKCKSF